MARLHSPPVTRRPFEITRDVLTSASPEEVLAIVRSPATWPQWQSEIVTTEGPDPVTPGDVVRGDASMLGFEVDGHSTIETSSESILDEDVIVGLRMRVTYSVELVGDRTRLRHKFSARLPGGVWGGLLALFMRRRFRKMQRDLLADLARHVERAAKKPAG